MPNDAAAEKAGSAEHGDGATVRCHHDSNSPVHVGASHCLTTAEVALSLDGQGRIVGAFAPDRPPPWRGRFSDYRRHNDMWLPFAGEVGWEIDGVEEIYWQGRMEHWDTQNESRRSAPCSGHLSQIGVVGQFDCGRRIWLERQRRRHIFGK